MKNKVVKYILAGLAYLLPAGLLIFILYKGFVLIDRFTRYLIPEEYQFPGLGIVVLIVALALFGWFTTVSRLDDWLKAQFIKLLNRIPILKNIYSSLEDITSALVGEKKTFDKPVLVKLSNTSDIERIGFIAKEDLTALGIPEGKIAIALPFTFSYMSKIVIVPKENVTPLKAKSSEVMKFVVSGGITSEEKDHSIITE